MLSAVEGRFMTRKITVFRDIYLCENNAYQIHILFAELIIYRFGKKRDCIDLNTIDDTWYVFPERCEFSVTKISLAVEEIYNEIWRRRHAEKQKSKE